MQPARTLAVGLEVHQDSIAVADVGNDHAAEVIDLGPMGTRPCDSDHLVRQLQANATHLVFVDEAGPGGSWRSRDLTPKGADGWVVAPAVLPTKAGARVNTERRAAVHVARLRRSGALPGRCPHRRRCRQA